MDNYSILNLKSGATIVEIKARYRVLCKQYHPDKTGGDKDKTEKFLAIKDAYEALLVGDNGTSKNYNKNNYGSQTKDSNFKSKKKVATYSFITIKKDSVGYLVSFRVYGVSEIEIFGKSYNRIGTYNVSGVEGIVNLRVKLEEAKRAGYLFKCRLYDDNGNYAEVTYKVKPPSIFSKIKEFFKL